MYLPTHFEVTDTAAMHRLIREHPLGSMVVLGPDGLDANPLPFELDAQAGTLGTLRAHVARANPLLAEIGDGAAVIVVFQGAQGYISPNWYPSKHETHRLVPTWNYQVVNAHGSLRWRDDERYVRGVIARLTREHESRTAQSPPWRMGDSAPEYIDSMVKAIVGLEIPIDRLAGKFKLSQNREHRDLVGAVEALARTESVALADAMNEALRARQD